MSDDLDDVPLQLDLREQIGRIDRDRAEAVMLTYEALKYRADALRLWRLAPWFVFASAVGALIGSFVARMH